jgi:hypothetical protein
MFLAKIKELIFTFDNRNYLVESTLEVLEQELDAKRVL